VRLTIDTSVFISRLREDDPSHTDSRAFLDALPGRNVMVILPNLVGPEIAGATRRFTGQQRLAREALELLEPLPNLNLVGVDQQLAANAVSLAAESGLRGSDAVFAATAQLFDAVIVSLDKDHASRCPKNLRVLTPGEALEELRSVR
jgi:predicted nucleic acid-binding protein